MDPNGTSPQFLVQSPLFAGPISIFAPFIPVVWCFHPYVFSCDSTLILSLPPMFGYARKSISLLPLDRRHHMFFEISSWGPTISHHIPPILCPSCAQWWPPSGRPKTRSTACSPWILTPWREIAPGSVEIWRRLAEKTG